MPCFKEMGKVKTIIAAAAAVIIAAGIGTSLYFNVKMAGDLKDVKELSVKLGTKVEEIDSELNKETPDGEFDEDGNPIIGGSYVIRDYSRIANAYINGDTTELVDDTDKEIYDLASDLLKEIIKDGMTDYEKELAIHDWLAANVSFDGNSLMAIPAASKYCDSPYGVLKYKSAVCVGYATTFRLLTNMLGMECEVIHDTEFSHSWDVIKLDDGEYYLVDVTFDAGENGSFTHENFNLNEAAFSQGHTWNVTDYPRANGTKYNYAVMNKTEIKDIYEIPKLISDAMENNTTELYFSIKDAPSMEVSYKIVEMISERVSSNEDIYMSASVTPLENNDYVIGVTIPVYNTDVDPEGLEGIDAEKLFTLIDKYFGESYGDYGDYDDYEKEIVPKG